MSRHVIERCPSCGLEHDERADECQACHTALRYWCRAHSREVGWLERAECRRCAEDEARRRPRASEKAVPLRAAAPAPATPPAPRTVTAPPPVLPGPPGEPARDDPRAAYDPDPLSAFIRTSILVVIAGVAGGGILAWFERYPPAILQTLAVLAVGFLTLGLIVANLGLGAGKDE